MSIKNLTYPIHACSTLERQDHFDDIFLIKEYRTKIFRIQIGLSKIFVSFIVLKSYWHAVLFGHCQIVWKFTSLVN